MNKSGNEGSGISLVQLVSVVPAISFCFSVVYIIGYSQSTGIPILSFMSLQNIVVSSLPWLIPSMVVFGLLLVFGTITAKVELAEAVGKEDFQPLWARIVFSNTFMIGLLMGFISILELRNDESIFLQLPVLFTVFLIGVMEFGHYSRHFVEFVELFGVQRFRFVSLMTVMLLATFSSGISNGSYGGHLFSGSEICRVYLASDPEVLVGSVPFLVGEYILFYPEDGEGTMLILRADILRIESTESERRSKVKEEIKSS
ncbi:hypothetical protein [Psychromonas algicola]|uniref:hypothetical protein n=1 Tax=Psychromonas algicola TaxID=2555642 RepID=UPI0010688B91|nr:hypothetical protein [Psychromonas sp. RZ5]TEW52779.1 hypothetical protein E2R67_01820 [Psychromonas sp. RZ5]